MATVQGDLARVGVPELLRALADEHLTGRLLLTHDDARIEVFLRDGKAYGAHTERGDGGLGRRLVAAGLLSNAELESALDEKSADGRSLGAILEDSQIVDRANMEAIATDQLEDTLFEALKWEAGTFEFDREGASQEDVDIRIPVSELVTGGARRFRRWHYISRKVPSLDAIVHLAEGDEDLMIDMTPDEWSMVSKVDGEMTIAEIAKLCGFTDIEAAKASYGLVNSGLVRLEHPEGFRELPDSINADLEAAFDELERALEEAATDSSGTQTLSLDSLLQRDAGPSTDTDSTDIDLTSDSDSSEDTVDELEVIVDELEVPVDELKADEIPQVSPPRQEDETESDEALAEPVMTEEAEVNFEAEPDLVHQPGSDVVELEVEPDAETQPDAILEEPVKQEVVKAKTKGWRKRRVSKRKNTSVVEISDVVEETAPEMEASSEPDLAAEDLAIPLPVVSEVLEPADAHLDLERDTTAPPLEEMDLPDDVGEPMAGVTTEDPALVVAQAEPVAGGLEPASTEEADAGPPEGAERAVQEESLSDGSLVESPALPSVTKVDEIPFEVIDRSSTTDPVLETPAPAKQAASNEPFANISLVADEPTAEEADQVFAITYSEKTPAPEGAAAAAHFSTAQVFAELAVVSDPGNERTIAPPPPPPGKRVAPRAHTSLKAPVDPDVDTSALLRELSGLTTERVPSKRALDERTANDKKSRPFSRKK